MAKMITRLLAGFLLLCTAWASQTVNPLTSSKQYFHAADGQSPCAGCKLYTYAAGTTTALATYSESTGTTPNANPIILDSTGYATIYVLNQSYKLVLKDANDVQIWSQDNIGSSTSTLTAGTTIKFADCVDTLLAGCNGSNATITGSNGSFVVASGGGGGGAVTVAAGTAGGAVNLTASDGVSAALIAGGAVTITGGAGVVGSNSSKAGGNIFLVPGTSPSSFNPGHVEIKDGVDTSKIAKLDVAGITTATTRTYTFPDASTTFVGTDANQTLTNKTANSSTNTIGLLGAGFNNSVNLLNWQAPIAALTGTSADQTVFTYTIPANTLQSGKCIDIEVGWQHTTGTASIAYKVVLGTTTLASISDSGTSASMATLRFCNNGSQASQATVVFPATDGTSIVSGSMGFGTAAENLANAAALKFTFNVANTDQVTGKWWRVVETQ